MYFHQNNHINFQKNLFFKCFKSLKNLNNKKKFCFIFEHFYISRHAKNNINTYIIVWYNCMTSVESICHVSGDIFCMLYNWALYKRRIKCDGCKQVWGMLNVRNSTEPYYGIKFRDLMKSQYPHCRGDLTRYWRYTAYGIQFDVL